MSADYWSSQMLVMAAFGVAMAYGPVIALDQANQVIP
jgi:hypothetical protein